MNSNKPAKTLGHRTAALMSCLAAADRTVFTIDDAVKCMDCDRHSAAAILHKASRRGLITPIARGLYNVVPFAAGDFHYSHPLLIVREAVREEEYFFSHATAMELHRMTTQPYFEVYLSVVKRQLSRTLAGTPVHFVTVRPDRFFGREHHWLTKTEKVMVSDVERTVIDGLTRPGYCGGMLDVAKGLWFASPRLDAGRAAEYALHLNVRAVIARLGYLLEFYELGGPDVLRPLRERVTRTVHLLDPQGPKEGRIDSGWGLQLNLSLDELSEQRST